MLHYFVLKKILPLLLVLHLLFSCILVCFSQSSDSIFIEKHHKEGLNFFFDDNYLKAINSWKTTLYKKIDFYGEEHLETARTYYNIGSAYYNLSMDAEAKEFYKKALAIRLKKIKTADEKLLNNIINNYKFLGKSLKETGDFDQALSLYESCLQKIDKTHEKYPGVLKYKAQTLKEKKGEHIQEAIKIYQEVISIFRKRKDDFELAKALNDLGNVYDLKKEHSKALDCYKEAFSLLKKINDYDVTYNIIIKNTGNLGSSYTKTQQFEQAEKTLNNAVTIAKEVYGNSPIMPDYFYPYYLLGELYQNKNEHEKALTFFNQAMDNVIVDFTQQYSKNKSLHLDDLSVIGHKSDIIDILFKKGKNLEILNKEDALFNYEFTDQVISSLRNEIETESSNLIWAETTREIYTHAAKVALELQQNEKAFDFIEKSKAVLLYENLLREKTERISTLPDSLKIQWKTLKKELSILQEDLTYSIIDNKKEESKKLRDEIFLKKREKETFEETLEKHLPKKSFNFSAKQFFISDFQDYLQKNNLIAIDFFGDENNLISLVIQPNEIKSHIYKTDSTFQKNISEWINIISQPINKKSTISKGNQLAYSIYEYLFEPLDIPENKNLLIIPDGRLQSIPFEALITNKENQYLLFRNPISYAYSANVQLQLTDIKKEIKKHALIVSPQHYKDLPNLKPEEALSTQALIQGDLLEKEKANTTYFLENASDYELLHLSTHASIHEGALSQPWIAFHDRKLNLSELYSLDLNARLVTLSACETAKGELIKGEGVLSLARGFNYIGVPQVITSLWSVNENSTQKIMENFYQSIKNKKSPSEALHEAKIKYIQEHDLAEASPYHWAAFTAIGHDTYVYNSKNNFWLWIGGGILFLCFLFFAIQKINKGNES